MSGAYFYGDLNCPFCYAENERIVRLGVGAALSFRGVEHLPDLPTPWQPSDEGVRAEVERLRHRAPDVEIVVPPGHPNTRLALSAIADASALDAAAASQLRTALFRALWRDGRDVSDPQVVADLWALHGLGEYAPTREGPRQVRLWTVAWRNGPFDQRIPVLATEADERLLGLFSEDDILDFVATRAGGIGADVCRGRSAGDARP